jgi:glycerol-3-phosphate acyltransferase PlsY
MAVKTPGLWSVLGVSVAVWIAVMLVSRVVSLATLSATVAFPVCTVLFGLSAVYVWMGVILSLLIVYRHKANIARLLRGEEFSFKKGKKDV